MSMEDLDWWPSARRRRKEHQCMEVENEMGLARLIYATSQPKKFRLISLPC